MFLVNFDNLAEEMMLYNPGIRELSAGWRETGNYNRSNSYLFS
jgi:hypothetical protein